MTDHPDSVGAELRTLRRTIWVGIVALFVALLAWAGVAEIDTAVVSTGEIRPDQSRLVQQLESGRIKRIFKHDGDRVKAGEPLLVLDDDGRTAELAVLTVAHQELLVRRAYLKARSGDSQTLELPSTITSANASEELQGIIAEYRKMLVDDDEATGSSRRIAEKRLDAQESSSSRLAEQIDSLEASISDNKDKLSKLDSSKPTEALEADSISRVLQSLEAQLDDAEERRDLSRASEEDIRAQLAAQEDESEGHVQSEIATIEADIIEADLQRQQADRELRRLTVTAPVDGVIHEARPLAEGDVIAAGESAIEVIPAGDDRIAVVRLPATDVDAVKPGARVAIKLSSFAPGTMPDLEGTTTQVASAPDVNPETGASTYAVQVQIDQADLARLPNPKRVIAGMPIEAFFNVGETRILNYLVAPLLDQIRRSAPA